MNGMLGNACNMLNLPRFLPKTSELIHLEFQD